MQQIITAAGCADIIARSRDREGLLSSQRNAAIA
jgi:hypothetical protein